MGFFFGKSKGEKLKGLSKRSREYKCEHCGHNKFVNAEYIYSKRYDSVYADCAKCGKRFSEDGPMPGTG